MKLYVISWSTLLDLLACLINAVFNLGIVDRDVKMQLVFNNRHVQSSRIPQIIREYEKTSVIKDLKKKRNDLVHRGMIPDTDIEQILGERNTMDSRRYSILQMNQISEEEYKKTKLSIAGEAERFSEGEARPMAGASSANYRNALCDWRGARAEGF